MFEHAFWSFLTMACIVWYSTITIYVSVKGVADIRDMLRRLSSRESRDHAAVDRNDTERR